MDTLSGYTNHDTAEEPQVPPEGHLPISTSVEETVGRQDHQNGIKQDQHFIDGNDEVRVEVPVELQDGQGVVVHRQETLTQP